METVTESNKEHDIDMRNTNIWYNNCPFVRELQEFGEGTNSASLHVATGKIREGFEWIKDDNVICTDAIDGLRITADFSPGKTLDNIATRNCIYVNPVFHHNIFAAVSSFAKISLHSKFQGEVHGVIVGNPSLIMKDSPSRICPWQFISHEQMQKQHRRKQWHTGPKTVESVERWLYEDLNSRVDQYKSAQSEYSSHRDDGSRRPDGLVFWQDTGMVAHGTEAPIYRTARVHNRTFAWWWIENNRIGIKDRDTLNMVRKDVFARLKKPL